MTRPQSRVEYTAARILAEVQRRIAADEPPPPWNERMEARIDQVAQTWDPETRTHQNLRRTR